MSGSGALDGDSPPWGPADPVPELRDTQAIPGLGSVPAPSRPSTGTEHEEPAEGDGDTEDGAKDRARNGNKSAKRQRGFWRELPVLIVIALVLALLIKSFVVQAFWIPSGSMENTLEVNDRVLVNKVVYHTRSIHRGDIVVFDGSTSWDAGEPQPSENLFSKAVDELEGVVGISDDPYIYIKRVIGLPGDHVVCCDSKGQVTVNGVALTESSYLYPGNSPSQSSFNITVPDGDLWVMGDHRAVSYDSRGHMGDPGGGAIPVSSVIGRAFVIIWPASRWGFLNIPATFEQPKLNASTPAAAASPPPLETAIDNGTPVRQTTSPIPLALGFAAAVPLTWLQRKARRRLRNRRLPTTARGYQRPGFGTFEGRGAREKLTWWT
jgi:signal peptidase I